MSQTILVFGRSGQVARELDKLGVHAGFQLEFAGREDLDLGAGVDPRPLIEARAPTAVINAAAYTAVDKAESDADAAFRLNRDAPAAIARACADLGLPLVHFSTDYVFDGTKAEPYVEDDPIRPLGVYGRSKAEGEAAVLESDAWAGVLRTAWVYSAHSSNFLKTMLRLGQTRDEIGVVDDQFGRPTWARDCAVGALRLVQALLDRDTRAARVLHLTGAGDATWADFAEAIFAESASRGGPHARVKRITTADYPTLARRPANSRLDCAKIAGALDLHPRHWRDSLATCFDELGVEGS